MLLAIILLFAGVAQGATPPQEKPKPTTPPASVDAPTTPTASSQSEKAQSQAPKPGTLADKPGTAKAKSWRVTIKDDFGVPFVTVRAKKSSASEISAEIGRLLKIPVSLGNSLKQELVTADFKDLPIEAALKQLAPRPVVDYIITGGNDSSQAVRKRPLAIYLLGPDDKAPQQGPWTENKATGQLMVGMVYESEEEEKVALEKRKEELKVTYANNLFTVSVYKQFLTDVLQEVAAQAHIPFAILTTNGAQKEIDQVVTWSFSGVNFEELTNTWFPNGVRLYWRTDLASDVSKPLRLTIEGREEDAQAVQNVTP